MFATKILISFAAGLVGFLSPCVLPLLPGYVAYMTGGAVGERVPLRRSFPGSLAFVLGLAVVFISLGASASAIFSVLAQHKRTIEIVSGIFIVALGLFMLAARRSAWLMGEKRFHVEPGVGPLRTFVLGMAFAFGWTPCIGPTLGAALNLAATSGGLTAGIVLLAAYSLGLGLPFLLAGLGLVTFSGRLKRWTPAIQVIGGVMLIGVGLLIVTGRLTLITVWMQRTFGRLGLDFWNF